MLCLRQQDRRRISATMPGMPPRYAYWVIILDGAATSFGARSPEKRRPTFNRLRAKDPGARLRWFERGKLSLCNRVVHTSKPSHGYEIR